MRSKQPRAILALAISMVAMSCQSAGPIELGGPRTITARGALSYVGTAVGSRLYVSIELGLRFELIVRRVDASSVRELGRVDLGPPDWDITAIGAASSGPLVWLASRDGTVRAVDVEAMKVVRVWPLGVAVTSVAASADGALVAYGTDTGIVCLRRVRDAALLQCVHVADVEVSALEFFGDELISGLASGTLTRWTRRALARVASIELSGRVSAIAAAPDGRLAVAIGHLPNRKAPSKGGVYVVSGSSVVGCVDRVALPSTMAIDWTREGQFLVSGSNDGALRVWRPKREACELVTRRFLGRPVSHVVSPTYGSFLAAGMWPNRPDGKTAVLLDYRAQVRGKRDL